MSYSGRERGKSGNNGFSRYSEHDDRTGPSQKDYDQKSFRGKAPYRHGSNRRGRRGGFYRGSSGSRGGNFNYRGGFQNNRGSRRPYGRRGGAMRHSHDNDRADSSPLYKDDDGDVRMEGDQDSDMRYKPYARPQRRNARGQIWQDSSKQSWFQVTIVNGSTLEEEWLHEQIQSYVTTQYKPTQYHIDGKNSCFFVDDSSAAEAIRRCSKRFTSPDGMKVLILMRPTNFPPFSDTDIENIEKALSERFTVDSQHVDLSRFYNEPKLKDRRVKLDLSYHAYVVAKIMVQNIPLLLSIDLSGNNLSSCESFKLMASHLSTVKKLNLKRNKFLSFKDLTALKPWDLSELTLDQNPLCSNYKSQTDYISDARDYFPNLAVLDGHELPSPVVFDVDSGKLPTPIRDFFSPAGQEVINQFVKNYFACYDQSRMGLLEAYNEAGLFTIAIPSSPRGPSLSKYIDFSRNLKKLKSAASKVSTTSANRTEILSKLSQLPPTSHVTASFAIDVPLVTSTIVKFIVRGLYEETTGERRLRAFSRSFFCRVVQSTLQIINEQYFIRNPTASEFKDFKTMSKTAAKSISQPQLATTSQHSEMIAAFMKESGMNAKYSEQCLAENNWDYARAGQVFLQLKNENKIPQDAFV